MRFEPFKRQTCPPESEAHGSHAGSDPFQQPAEAQRCLASLLESLPGVFYRCELTPPWHMSFVSDGVEPLTGYSRAELEKTNGWSDLIDRRDVASVEKAVREAVEEHRSFEITYRILHKDGSILWVAERGKAVFGTAGEPLYLEGVISDVSGRRQADQLERTMFSKWRTTLDTIPQMVWTMAADGSDDFFNGKWIEFTGARIGGRKGVDRLSLVHPDDRDEAARRWRSSFDAGHTYEAQYRLRHHSGEYRWVLSRGCLEKDASGVPLRWYGTCTEVHESVLAREALRASEEINRSIVAASPDFICLLDNTGKLRFMNEAYRQVLGAKTADAFNGRRWDGLFPPNIRASAKLVVDQARTGQTGHFSAPNTIAGETRWWDVIVAPTKSEEGAVTGIITIARDMTRQKIAEEQIRWAANHDALTGLPNRSLFQSALDEALSAAGESGRSSTVLMLDLDEFKRTNDALGHDAGDALLMEFSKRLRAAVRSEDIVARLGGDEFAVILKDVGHIGQIEGVAANILRSLEAPFEFEGSLLDIRSTIGASIYPDHGDSRMELLKHADTALYVAKASNKGGLSCFHPGMRAEVRRRMLMLSLAKRALEEDRILAYYQPKLNLRSGKLDGFEALLRWTHANRRIHRPAAIQAALKDASLAADISDKMVCSVISDVRAWKEADVQFGHVAINAGAVELRKGNFADLLLERLRRAQIPVSAIQVEVTETVFLGRGAETVQRTLQTLASEGIRIALDDFGTGFASLSHLARFPVHALKIDRSFVSKLEHSTHDAAIIRAIIKLGRSLGVDIVAEGVESEAQLNFLKKHRCHHGQGYFFARAQPASEIPHLVSVWAQGGPAAFRNVSERRSTRLAA